MLRNNSLFVMNRKKLYRAIMYICFVLLLIKPFFHSSRRFSFEFLRGNRYKKDIKSVLKLCLEHLIPVHGRIIKVCEITPSSSLVIDE